MANPGDILNAKKEDRALGIRVCLQYLYRLLCVACLKEREEKSIPGPSPKKPMHRCRPLLVALQVFMIEVQARVDQCDHHLDQGSGPVSIAFLRRSN